MQDELFNTLSTRTSDSEQEYIYFVGSATPPCATYIHRSCFGPFSMIEGYKKQMGTARNFHSKAVSLYYSYLIISYDEIVSSAPNNVKKLSLCREAIVVKCGR